MVDYRAWLNRPKRIVKMFPVNRHRVERIVERHLRRKMREIGEMEAKEILEAYGFITPRGSLAPAPSRPPTSPTSSDTRSC